MHSNKIMILKVFLLFVSVVYCQFQSEGDLCYKDGQEGVCRSLSKCIPAQQDIKNFRNPQVCAHENNVAIVCCVEGKPGAPAEPARPSVPQNLEGQCKPLPEDMSPKKIGKKAFDKCIEYQKEYVYPCKQGTDLLGSVSRQYQCHHTTEELIIGGTDAKLNEFPHMVMLGFEDNGSIDWGCGGAIISERFVLSAGHCISTQRTIPASHIVIGALKRSDANNQKKIYKVKKIIPHPQYKSPSRYNDIALFETERVMELDQFTVPACLHTGDVVNDTKVIAAGWGLTHSAAFSKPSEALKRVILSKFAESECAQKYMPHRLMTRGFDDLTQMCYGDRDPPMLYQGRLENKDTCQGDSGGPIQIKDQKIHCMYTIVGVTSIGRSSCGNSQKPALYTRVSKFLPWIESVVWPN